MVRVFYKTKIKGIIGKNFIINKEYILLTQQVKQTTHTKGGHNKETIMLNIKTFKKYCLKAGTSKADEIHEYYIKLEETLQEVIQEESNELKMQLQQKDDQLEEKDNQMEIIIKDKKKIREKTLLEQFPNNTQCIYYGMIDNLSDKNEKLIKFGNSNNLKNRVINHKDTYSNFILINAFKVDNKLQIENAMKENKIFAERQRTITIKNKNYIEILNIEGITFTELDKIIKDIITSIEFSPENYIKILEENKLLKKQIEQKNETDKTNELIFLSSENKKLKIENIILSKKYNALKNDKNINDIYEDTDDNDTEQIQKASQNDIDNYSIVIKTMTQNFTKNKNGTINIDNKIYEKMCGSREDVWNCKAYKTTGGLIKNDLLINTLGKIVSKKKCIQETSYNRLVKFGVNKPKECKIIIPEDNS